MINHQPGSCIRSIHIWLYIAIYIYIYVYSVYTYVYAYWHVLYVPLGDKSLCLLSVFLETFGDHILKSLLCGQISRWFESKYFWRLYQQEIWTANTCWLHTLQGSGSTAFVLVVYIYISIIYDYNVRIIDIYVHITFVSYYISSIRISARQSEAMASLARRSQWQEVLYCSTWIRSCKIEMGVSLNGGTPKTPQVLIILSRKTQWFLGTTILGNPQILVLDLQIQTWWLESFVVDRCAATSQLKPFVVVSKIKREKQHLPEKVASPRSKKNTLFPRLVSPPCRASHRLYRSLCLLRDALACHLLPDQSNWWRKIDEQIWKVDKADTLDVADVLLAFFSTVLLFLMQPFRHLHSATTCLGILRRAPQHWPSSLQLLQRCRDQRIELESWQKLEPTSWSFEFRLDDFYSIVLLKHIWRHGFQNSSFKLFVFFGV